MALKWAVEEKEEEEEEKMRTNCDPGNNRLLTINEDLLFHSHGAAPLTQLNLIEKSWHDVKHQ